MGDVQGRCAESHRPPVPPRLRERRENDLIQPRQPGIQVSRQPARGAAGEAQCLGLAAWPGERAVGRGANHLGIVAIGDDQAGAIGPEPLALERR